LFMTQTNQGHQSNYMTTSQGITYKNTLVNNYVNNNCKIIKNLENILVSISYSNLINLQQKNIEKFTEIKRIFTKMFDINSNDNYLALSINIRKLTDSFLDLRHIEPKVIDVEVEKHSDLLVKHKWLLDPVKVIDKEYYGVSGVNLNEIINGNRELSEQFQTNTTLTNDEFHIIEKHILKQSILTQPIHTHQAIKKYDVINVFQNESDANYNILTKILTSKDTLKAFLERFIKSNSIHISIPSISQDNANIYKQFYELLLSLDSYIGRQEPKEKAELVASYVSKFKDVYEAASKQLTVHGKQVGVAGVGTKTPGQKDITRREKLYLQFCNDSNYPIQSYNEFIRYIRDKKNWNDYDTYDWHSIKTSHPLRC